MSLVKEVGLKEIVAYEKTLNTPILSSHRILNYFGAENICKIYSCTIVNDRIAYADDNAEEIVDAEIVDDSAEEKIEE